MNTELKVDDFLAKNDIRTYLEEPFFLDNHKVFTNGHVLVMHKCVGIDSIKESLAPTVRNFMEQLEQNTDWSPMPEIEFKFSACTSCDGTGKAKQERCGECDGEGEVEWSSGSHDYAADCKACDGDGWWLVPGGDDDCDTCGGSGKRYELRHYMVGESAFNPKYLAMIQAEGTEINQPGKNEMLLFRNGDAFGLIMGIRI
jgi:hypothetical protein